MEHVGFDCHGGIHQFHLDEVVIVAALLLFMDPEVKMNDSKGSDFWVGDLAFFLVLGASSTCQCLGYWMVYLRRI